ncbi:MAG: UMP kinase [Candidatus Thermoplasmatota archaeon]|jgi:uridylate kinase|nr:UMP kinase [Candidatus Thermoplasmatota archaeon]MCL5800257.1 UMP kinase [Candidatus Thermoplasmatota archaeon]
MPIFVISLGGSVVTSDPLDIMFIKRFSAMIGNAGKGNKFCIVIGGGKLARSYINALREAGVNDNILDEIGINATRMNALSVAPFLGDCNTKIPTTINEAAEMTRIYRCVIMGGTEPGHTTDTVAALLAERVGAKVIINGTSVDGVYERDPRKYSDAKKLKALGYDEAVSMAVVGSLGAGPNVFMDVTSLNIARRSKIRIVVIDGRDVEQYEKVINGMDHSGTTIS